MVLLSIPLAGSSSGLPFPCPPAFLTPPRLLRTHRQMPHVMGDRPAAAADPPSGLLADLRMDLDEPPIARAPGRAALDDVERISRGQAARKKRRGTGSRNVPHRLNQEERKLYDIAKGRRYLVTSGSAYRRERKGSPLANIYRQWCDAQATPCINIQKGLGPEGSDLVVVDLSPLRRPASHPVMQQLLESLCSLLSSLGCTVVESPSIAAEPSESVPTIEGLPALDWDEWAIWELPEVAVRAGGKDREGIKAVCQAVLEWWDGVGSVDKG
ncbi:unnamed protein product [Vitrella brassicaformis CCMP3155]|uniref:Uncharacterized protein n=1 Tax=Vitrella brassicaformis (strain CCMP3155) TaxID=1169540 RepID=A0A0G4EX23_VITBC|nr:unnamed protein product [Vitrella brassicaformis CCMP3155]|mmetsp:Transcript_27395/g.78850  ORF Transcript_27395/g.78850 Transcript_27395/m.78850 type:complete len:270 (-) Transcript_27395:386-1195(-)|eukprot:CEM03333.1 unnamed protein product [Vitrella brassicaformis CCMP3155]